MPDTTRREFVALIGGGCLLLAVKVKRAWGQQPAMPVVGFLSGRSPSESAYALAAFHQGLKQGGYVEGQNVAIEYRWAEGQYDRLPALVGDLLRHQVSVIAATGANGSALAAKQATTTIPIVFTSSDDPVKLGLVASLNRPGGNATGINFFISQLEGKRLGLLHELIPKSALIGVLLNPTNAPFESQLKDVEEAARALGREIHILQASKTQDIHVAFKAFVQMRVQGLLVGGDPFFNGRREQLVTLADHYAIPAIYELRDYVTAGGLMSYGTSLPNTYRQIGIYTARVLKGEHPSDLPVVQPTKFEFVINLSTAKVLGLEVQPPLSARADEVIE